MMVYYSSSEYEDPQRFPLEVGNGECLTRPVEQRSIAERCAYDFHHNHDGLDCRWPRDITLYATEVGPPLASFEVECERVPQFYARRKDCAA